MSNDEPDIVQRLDDGIYVMEHAATEILGLRAKVSRLEAQLVEAIEALKPFVPIPYQHPDGDYDPEIFSIPPFSFEDCERAKAIVEKHK